MAAYRCKAHLPLDNLRSEALTNGTPEAVCDALGQEQTESRTGQVVAVRSRQASCAEQLVPEFPWYAWPSVSNRHTYGPQRLVMLHRQSDAAFV